MAGRDNFADRPGAGWATACNGFYARAEAVALLLAQNGGARGHVGVDGFCPLLGRIQVVQLGDFTLRFGQGWEGVDCSKRASIMRPPPGVMRSRWMPTDMPSTT